MGNKAFSTVSAITGGSGHPLYSNVKKQTIHFNSNVDRFFNINKRSVKASEHLGPGAYDVKTVQKNRTHVTTANVLMSKD